MTGLLRLGRSGRRSPARRWFLAEGTQNFFTARSFYKRAFEWCIARNHTHDSQVAETMRRPVRERGVAVVNLVSHLYFNYHTTFCCLVLE